MLKQQWQALLTIVVTREDVMLWTICVVLIVLWLLGIVTSYTMGGLIHILLVIAIIVVLVRIIQGRKVL
jgi:hypothetical protein